MLLLMLLLADSSHTRKLAVAPAESLSVQLAGAGDPVVLIPGLFGSAYAYRKVVPLLTEAGYRTIVIEPLGIGLSTRPKRADYSLTAQADRIGAVLDTLGVRGALVLAHSAAGSMAFRLAYRRPELVRALVSLEGGPAESATTPGFKRAMRFATLIKLINGIGLIRQQIHQALIRSSGDTTWITDEVMRGYTVDAERAFGATIDAFRAMSRSAEPEALEPQLVRIACPVVMLVGTAEHESAVSETEVALLGRVLPGFALDSVLGAGHYLHEERPDRVAAAVRRVGEATAGAAKP